MVGAVYCFESYVIETLTGHRPEPEVVTIRRFKRHNEAWHMSVAVDADVCSSNRR